jgi:hypothetical protein
MSEVIREQALPTSYVEVVRDLEQVVASYTEWESISEHEERGTTAFDGTIRPFNLPAELTQELGLGKLVRSRVIGSVEEGMGIAVIVRSLNPFNRNVHGFFIRPAEQEQDGPTLYDRNRGFEVFEGSAQWPKRNGVYWGAELLGEDVHPSNSSTTDALVATIQKHALHKSK